MRLGIISDIHEDITNLRKTLAGLNETGVDEVVCLGDIVGFNVEFFSQWQDRDAVACINLVKNSCIRVIPGNHDFFAIRKVPVYRGGFEYAPNWYGLDYHTRKHMGNGKIWLYEETELSARLDAPCRAYLDSLPETDSLHTDNLKLLFTHYIYPNVTGSETGFTENRENFRDHLRWMNAKGFHMSFSGHGHIEGVLIANEAGYTEYGFHQTVKISNGSAIVVPAIVRGRRAPGFVTFNTESLEIMAHPLPD